MMLLSIMQGLISGLLSYALVMTIEEIFLTPGIIFGISLAFLAYIREKKIFLIKKLIFLLFSTGGYFAAVYVFLTTVEMFEAIISSGIIALAFSLMLGGFIGTAVLLVGYYFLIHTFSAYYFILLPILGGLLSLSWFILPEESMLQRTSSYVPSAPDEALLGLYLFWQIGIAAGIGWATRKSLN